MKTGNLGNRVNQIVKQARGSMFDQGELTQLSYGAFDIAAASMQSMEQEEIEVKFPIGYNPDHTVLDGTRTYNKEQLLQKYQYLAFNQLSINALIQLVTLVETMLSDVVRAVILEFPEKIGGKRSIQVQSVLESSTIEEVQLRATDTVLNELAYKSSREFAESLHGLISINLLECPHFHKYVEVKATRDIYVHNRGIANDVYVRKAGSHVRCKSGMKLPVDIQYYLESYESCLSVADWLEDQLHSVWHSSEYEARSKPQGQLPLASPEAPDGSETGEN